MSSKSNSDSSDASGSRLGPGGSEIPNQTQGVASAVSAQANMQENIESKLESKLLTEFPAWLKRWPKLRSELHQVAWIGSLAHGGFSEVYSDFDLALFLTTSAHDVEANAQFADLVAQLPMPDRWSIFWAKLEPRPSGSKPRGLQIGRFPNLDQVDYLDHGHVIWDATVHPGEADSSKLIEQSALRRMQASSSLTETLRLEIARPSLAQIREHLRQESIPYWSDLLVKLEAHPSGGRTSMYYPDKSLVRLALYPSRFHFTWVTGRVDSNEAATRFCESRDWFDRDLVDAALYFRRLRLSDVGELESKAFAMHHKVITDLKRLRAQLVQAFTEIA
ncbi:MAG TPA: hypothetical protein PLZ57_06630 [Pseudobdellovibrionaceae bacterium]|nr:hypothetical protein [Pseudobdellovibrionaceae bacterium]